MDEGQKGVAELVVARGDAAELFELVEEAFDKVALAVQCLFPAESPFAPARVGDVGDRATGPDASSDTVGIVSLVGDDNGPPLEIGQERFGPRQIVRLAGSDQDLRRPALAVDARVDLGRETAAAASNTTISTLFLGPEAC